MLSLCIYSREELLNEVNVRERTNSPVDHVVRVEI